MSNRMYSDLGVGYGCSLVWMQVSVVIGALIHVHVYTCTCITCNSVECSYHHWGQTSPGPLEGTHYMFVVTTQNCYITFCDFKFNVESQTCFQISLSCLKFQSNICVVYILIFIMCHLDYGNQLNVYETQGTTVRSV